MSMSPAFVAHMKGKVQDWLNEAKAIKKEKETTTPKSRAISGRGGVGRRAEAGTGGNPGWSPPVMGVAPVRRQVRKNA